MQNNPRIESASTKNIFVISNLLIALSALAFVVLYLILSYYNRPVNDDITWDGVLKGKNYFQFISYFYTTWDGRWTSLSYFFLVMASSDSLMNIHHFMFIYYCITLLIFLYSVNAILRFCLKELFNSFHRQITTIVFSTLFIAGFYYFTFQNIEVWWWFTASIDYLQGLVFLLFGIALLIRERKNKFHYILIALSFIYVGGAFEIYVLIIGSTFLFVAINFLRKGKITFSSFRKSVYYKGILIALICFCVSAVVSISAPGNYQRRNSQTQLDSVSGNSLTKISFSVNLKTFAQKKYIVALVLSALWFLFGIKIRNSNRDNKNTELIKQALTILFVSLIVSIIIVILFQIVLLPNYVIPARGWTYTSFVGFIILCFLFLLLGYSFPIKKKLVLLSLGILLPFGTSAMVGANLIEQYKYAGRFAKEYDLLITTLLEAKNNNIKQPLELKPLPDSGSLNYLFLNDGMTTGLEKLLDLNYKIKVVQPNN